LSFFSFDHYFFSICSGVTPRRPFPNCLVCRGTVRSHLAGRCFFCTVLLRVKDVFLFFVFSLHFCLFSPVPFLASYGLTGSQGSLFQNKCFQGDSCTVFPGYVLTDPFLVSSTFVDGPFVVIAARTKVSLFSLFLHPV